jgi:Holliday junction resolvase RusA-like endonuclease
MIFVLTPPPSVNAMYYNVAGGGRRKTRQYAAWIRGELKALLAQRAKPFEGCATVTITLPKSKADPDNKIKPTLDLLVRAGVLKDDRSDYVSGVSVTVGDVQMMHVEVKPA